MTMIAEIEVLVDANILVYALNPRSHEHTAAHAALQLLAGRGYCPCVTTQIVRECLVAATGKLQREFPGRVEQAVRLLKDACAGYRLLGENDSCVMQTVGLAARYELRGKRIHDANIVAVMLNNGIRRLLTNNPDDFAPFAELIEIIPLAAVADRLV